MITSSLVTIARRSALALLVFAPLSTAACSAAPLPQEEEPTAEPVAASASEALTRNPCGLTPKAPVCNLPKCTPDGWIFYGIPKGSSCTTKTGQPGLCSGGDAQSQTMGFCSPNITGELEPKYYVLSVLYAPPGTSSTVDYGQGQTMGSTTTTKDSFSNSVSVSVSNDSSFLGFGSGGLTVTGSRTTSSDSSTAIDVKATTQTDFVLDGLHDAINHDLDRIYLWLNPQVNITANAIYGSSVSWSMAVRDGQNPVVMYVTPAWLKGTSPMPPDVAQALAGANVTAADYPTILGVDPFSNGGTTLDPNRFVYQTELPYEPVAVQGQNPTSTKYAITKSMTTTNGHSSSTEYGVGMTIKGSTDFLGFISLKLSATDQMKWTSQSSFSSSSGDNMAVTASIQQPAFGYDGPIFLDVYLDTVYNSFLFVLE